MHGSRRVLGFVVWGFLILLSLSVSAHLAGFTWEPFDRVNLVGGILVSDSAGSDAAVPMMKDTLQTGHPSENAFERYRVPSRIVGFHGDTNTCAIPRFMARLHAIRSNRKGKLRIAFFGDSMIEGDLITQTLRQLLQSQFGGAGVGYLPITSIVSGFRQTARSEYSGGWTDRNFKDKQDAIPLYLSGHAFQSDSAWARFTDRTTGDGSQVVEKYLLCGSMQGGSIIYNKREIALPSKGVLNRVLLRSDGSRSISLSATSRTPTIYGVSFESPDGIVLDNFAFRGVSGIELKGLTRDMLNETSREQPYDLIVFQYGVNVLYRPMDKEFQWYGKAMQDVIRRFSLAFPSADILVASSADCSFKYQGEYGSAIGVKPLVRVQAEAAFNSCVAFFNLFETMGGTNSMLDWIARKPPMANKDYVHVNSLGAAWLGEALFRAISHDYLLFKRSYPKGATPDTLSP